MKHDCRYLGTVVNMNHGATGYRIDGFGELYCILMNKVPCPPDCPDWKIKKDDHRELVIHGPVRAADEEPVETTYRGRDADLSREGEQVSVQPVPIVY